MEVPFKVTNIFTRNAEAKKPIVINVGGKGSSKSYSIAQLFIFKLLNEERKVFCISRKTLPSLRASAMQLFLDLMVEYGIYEEGKHNKTYNTYQYEKNRVMFVGLDEETKLRSVDFNYGWMEEANEFTYDDYTTIKLQMRRPEHDGNPNRLFLSLNPTDGNGWIPAKAILEEDVQVIHSTYKDNQFLSAAYVKSLTDLINYDQNAYRVYTLGEWGKVEGRIFTNYKRIMELPDMSEAKWAYGVDFGAVNESAIVKVYLKDGQAYAEEKFYRSGATYSDLIEAFSHMERGDIYCDPSNKQAVLEFRQAGLNAYEAHREVRDRIDLCQRNPVFIPESSINFLKEIAGFVWKRDPNNSERFLPEPVKYNDHAVDAWMYGQYGITERYGFATAKPAQAQPVEALHFPINHAIKWR